MNRDSWHTDIYLMAVARGCIHFLLLHLHVLSALIFRDIQDRLVHSALEFSSMPEMGWNPAFVLNGFVTGKNWAHDDLVGLFILCSQVLRALSIRFEPSLGVYVHSLYHYLIYALDFFVYSFYPLTELTLREHSKIWLRFPIRNVCAPMLFLHSVHCLQGSECCRKDRKCNNTVINGMILSFTSVTVN